MIRNPFYQTILDALAGELDPRRFQECAVDLLRSEWPALVPVIGGSDGGMDGAAADGLGEPFPLAVTISKGAVENLRQNLQSYLTQGGRRRLALFATSRPVTPAARKKLHAAAQELGFELVQIYDRTALAQRLYHSPRWCRELLGVAGDPPALSAFPVSSRPLFDVPLIGRERELAWIEKTLGDRILSGEPGSGKTFLLQQLVAKGTALFVVSGELRRITEELRSGNPRALIVEDAILELDLLSSLCHLRTSLGFEFEIVASCWPGDEDEVATALRLPSSRRLLLEPMTRTEIAEIIGTMGLAEPRELVGLIADQAEGRPGLAVTLAHLCLLGDVRSVAYGDSLKQSVIASFRQSIGDRAFAILCVVTV